jgi:hypothetical protein
MVNKFKRGFTAEEAALIATGLERFDSLLDAKRTLDSEEESVMFAEAELTNPYNDDGYASMSWDDVEAHKVDSESFYEAEKILEALLDEVLISCQWHDHLSGEVELYLTDVIPPPSNDTHLEVFQISRNAPDDEYSFYPIPNRTTITKVSLAKWFHNHIPDKANLFDPTGSYKNLNTGYSTANIQVGEKPNDKTKLVDLKSNFAESIVQTNTWQSLYKLTEKSLELFPGWQQSRPKPNNIPKSHIDDWLMENLKATKREAETIKKVIVEIFNL